MTTKKEVHSIVVYHKNCLDGFGAAYAAWSSGKLGDAYEEGKYTFTPLDYSDRQAWITEFSKNLLNKYDGVELHLYVLDFSFSKDDTQYLIQMVDQFVWLDHHKTAFESWCPEYPSDKEYLSLHRNTHIMLHPRKSGAVLAWEYFNPGSEIPEFITLIDDRDRWQWKYPETKFVTLALSQLEQDFRVWNNKAWEVDELAEQGQVIHKYFQTQLERMVVATKEECEILGKKGLCCNLPPMFASEAGHILANESGTFGATWYKGSDGSVKWSLRSNGDYDVSEIAKSFGGGGHKNAAGFVISDVTEPGVKLWLQPTDVFK